MSSNVVFPTSKLVDQIHNRFHDSLPSLVLSEQLHVLVVTYNCGSKLEDANNLMDFLEIPLGKTCDEIGLPDLVVVGLQEIIELSPTNVMSSEFTGNSAERSAKWNEAIINTLNSHEYQKSNSHQTSVTPYECIASNHMVGLFIGVYAIKTLTPYIRNIQTTSLARGTAGILGNKGALYVRCDIYDSSVCIVNNHFNAHRNKVSKRNEDYEAIISTPVFYDEVLGKPVHLPTHKPYGIDLTASTPTLTQLRNQQKDIRSRLHLLQQKINADDRNKGPSKGSGITPTAAITPTHMVDTNTPQKGQNHEAEAAVDDGTAYDSDDDDDMAVNSPQQPNIAPIKVNITPTNAPRNITPPALPTPSRHSGGMNNDSKLKSIADETFTFAADDHDVVIFLGDLNYRLSNRLDINQVYDIIFNRDFSELLPFDQLLQEKDFYQDIFHDFSEGELHFLPTYKYIPGTVNVYDQRPDKKLRVPAWCDRILWRIGRNKHREAMKRKEGTKDDSYLLMSNKYQSTCNIIRNMNLLGLDKETFERMELLLYQSLPQYLLSDHKPVKAVLNMTLKRVDHRYRDLIVRNCIQGTLHS